MDGADNRSFVEHAMAGLLALTAAPSAALTERQFLSLSLSLRCYKVQPVAFPVLFPIFV